ncbi:MAG: hypothetical protein AB9873_08240 [Syntrophobacteraceae bacterium]
MSEFQATQVPAPHVRLMIASRSGPVELSADTAVLPLPQGPDGNAPLLHYGPYLRGLAGLLLQNGCSPLTEAVSRRLGFPVSASDLRAVDIISEKHGALYNVARVRVILSDGECTLALSSATTDFQKLVMARETRALQELQGILEEDLLPRLLFEGDARYEESDTSKTLKVLVTGWFEDFHEFHLSRIQPDAPPATVVWDEGRGRLPLSEARAAEVYRKAARLLALCYDPESGRQVYPWHHAAGDFVVRCEGDAVDVRLITVRDYKRLISDEGEDTNPLLTLIHFFLNLTLRMRLDRFEGTGELVWMDRWGLDACISGFLDGCNARHAISPAFPDATEILEILRSFGTEEWYELLQVVAPDGLLEPDEAPFLGQHLGGHAEELTKVLLDAHA